MKKKMKSLIFILSIMVLIAVIVLILLSFLRVNGIIPETVSWYLQGAIVGVALGAVVACLTICRDYQK